MINLNLKTTLFDTEGTWETYKHEILVDGQTVGTAHTMTDIENDDETYLENIDICEGYRNKGYGSQTFYKLAEKYDYIYFAPTDENNQRLYERIAEEMTVDVPEVDQGYGVYFLER